MNHKTAKDDVWHQTFAALFGRQLTAGEVHAWQGEILTAFSGKVNPWVGEASEALRSMSTRWPKPDLGNHVPMPTARDLISEMKANRRKHMDASAGHRILLSGKMPGTPYQQTTYVVEPAHQWQAELRGANPDMRWEIICRPISNEQCLDREQFCADNGLEFIRFVPSEVYNVATVGAIQ